MRLRHRLRCKPEVWPQLRLWAELNPEYATVVVDDQFVDVVTDELLLNADWNFDLSITFPDTYEIKKTTALTHLLRGLPYKHQRIIQNAIQTPDGTILNSRDGKYEFVEYGGYTIDGGTNHISGQYDAGLPEPRLLHLTTESPEQEIVENLLWGVTMDEHGNRVPFHWRFLNELSITHLSSILATQQIDRLYQMVIGLILKSRASGDI